MRFTEVFDVLFLVDTFGVFADLVGNSALIVLVAFLALGATGGKAATGESVLAGGSLLAVDAFLDGEGFDFIVR